jgi:hypothetical protein
MDEKIVDDEINNPVNKDTYSYAKADLPVKNGPQCKCTNGYDGKKNKKGIVQFEKGIVVIPDVMVLMKVPERSVHHIFMHGPGHSFHKEGRNEYGYK